MRTFRNRQGPGNKFILSEAENNFPSFIPKSQKFLFCKPLKLAENTLLEFMAQCQLRGKFDFISVVKYI